MGNEIEYLVLLVLLVLQVVFWFRLGLRDFSRIPSCERASDKAATGLEALAECLVPSMALGALLYLGFEPVVVAKVLVTITIFSVMRLVTIVLVILVKTKLEEKKDGTTQR